MGQPLSHAASPVQIELLADRPEFIPVLASWHHQEWGYLAPHLTEEARAERMKLYSGRSAPPVILVATQGEKLLGSAMLLPSDMDTRPELSPWLAGVFAAPEYRGQGIGSLLSRHVVQHAATLGFSRLYLYTPSSEAFYTRLGWTLVEHTTYRSTQVAIMVHDSH